MSGAEIVADTAPGKLDVLKARVGRLELAVMENTEITMSIQREVAASREVLETVRDGMVAGRVATRAIKWVGAISIAASAVWASIYQLFHNGKLP